MDVTKTPKDQVAETLREAAARNRGDILPGAADALAALLTVEEPGPWPPAEIVRRDGTVIHADGQLVALLKDAVELITDCRNLLSAIYPTPDPQLTARADLFLEFLERQKLPDGFGPLAVLVRKKPLGVEVYTVDRRLLDVPVLVATGSFTRMTSELSKVAMAPGSMRELYEMLRAAGDPPATAATGPQDADGSRAPGDQS